MNIVPTLARAARLAATRRACTAAVVPRSLYSTQAAFRASPIALAKGKKRNRLEDLEAEEEFAEEVDDLFGSMPVSETKAKARAAAPAPAPTVAASPPAPSTKDTSEAASSNASPTRVSAKRDLAAEGALFAEAARTFEASLAPDLTLAGVGPKLAPLRTAIDNANTWQDFEKLIELMKTYSRRWRKLTLKPVEAFVERACAVGYPEVVLNEFLHQHATFLLFTPARLLLVQRALAAKLNGPEPAILESSGLPGAPEEKVDAPYAAAATEGEEAAAATEEEAPAVRTDIMDNAKATLVNRMLLNLALSHATPNVQLYALTLAAHKKLAPTPARKERMKFIEKEMGKLQRKTARVEVKRDAKVELARKGSRAVVPQVITPKQQQGARA